MVNRRIGARDRGSPTLNVLSYFRYPFPSTQGFSAYRMPGVAVHGPVLFCSTLAGFLLCWPHPALRPLVIIWAVAGLYLGRDFAIFCHYGPLLTLLAWAGCGAVLHARTRIAGIGVSHVVVPVLASVFVAIVQVAVAFRMTRRGA